MEHVEHLRPPKFCGDAVIFIEQLLMWMAEAGATNYDDAVTQFEHAMQSGALARVRGNPESVVVAALLHDVGHLLADEHSGHGDFLFANLKHENIGARWLARGFDESVTEPIRLHVDAKRYLCTVDAEYYERLSASSKRSFVVQGGPMSDDEAQAFKAEPYFAQAVEVRRIDDEAKVARRSVPGPEAYVQSLITGVKG